MVLAKSSNKLASLFLWNRKTPIQPVLLSKNKDSNSTADLMTGLTDDDNKKLQTDLNLMLKSLTPIELRQYHKDIFGQELNNNINATDESLQEALYGLVEKIQQVTLRTIIDNQRADPGTCLQRQLDIASLSILVDRMNKKRMSNQDWISDSEQLKRDINELVAKSSGFFKTANEYDEQRFELTPIKERDLFLFKIFSRIDRIQGRRMTNQDAEISVKRKHIEQQDDYLFSLINKMQQSGNNQKYTEQRAILKRSHP